MLESIRIRKEYYKAYIILVIITLIYVMPVLWSGRYYKDDLARTLYGVTGWNGDGRPLGQWLIVALTGFRETIDDIAPISWLIAIMILSYGLIVYAQNHLDDICGNVVCVIPLLFVVANPFAIENWSYRFDCIIMFTALSMVFLLYSLPKKSYVLHALLYFLVSLAVMSTYQAAIGMCIVLSALDIFLCIKRQKEIKSAFIYNVISMLMIGFGGIVYKFTIAEHYIDKLGWQNQASELLHGTLKETLVTVYNNVMGALSFIYRFWLDMSPVYHAVHILVIALAWGLTVLTCYQYRLGKHKVIWLGMGVLLLPVAFGGTFLPLIVLNSLLWDSKKLLSFGGFLFFVAVVLVATVKTVKWRKVCLVCLCICLFQQCMYMAAYGNALKAQGEYDEYLVHSIAYDVEAISAEEEESLLSFVGSAPRPREVVRLCEKYRHFDPLILPYFTNDTWMGGAYVYRYAKDSISIENITAEEQEQMEVLEPVAKHGVYSCYKIGNKVIVKFEK